MKHQFGGVWTQKKLSILSEYLQFYATALKNQPFTLHYVDAFAGTGSYNPIVEDNQQILVPHEDFVGSVRTALEVEPSFDQFHFNDLKTEHVEELNKIKNEHPQKNIQIYQQDANIFVAEYCKNLRDRDRATLFLDPYSTQLDWDTLKHVAKSKKVDLWLLFPISAILRMTPKNEIKPEWRGRLNRLLGTNEWEKALYKPANAPVTLDLFGSQDTDQSKQRGNVEEVREWVTERLQELFPYVTRPVRLDNNGRPLFLFYLAVSNPKEQAWGLANKVVSQIIKKHTGNIQR